MKLLSQRLSSLVALGLLLCTLPAFAAEAPAKKEQEKLPFPNCPEPAMKIVTTKPDRVVESCRIKNAEGAYLIDHGDYLERKKGKAGAAFIKGGHHLGKKQGRWEYYHRSNGKLWVEGNFVLDEGAGVWKMYDEKGKKVFEGNWQQFKRERRSESSNPNYIFFFDGKKR